MARDENAEKIKNRLPRENEKERLNNIKKLDFISKAVLGQLQNRFAVIKKYKPDVICLGYDQEADIEKLKKVHAGQIVRLRPYKKKVYKSSLIT